MSRVDLLQTPDEERWEHFVQREPRAGIYHSLAWRDVTREGLGHEPCYLCARDHAGEVVGILPLFRVRGWISGHRLVSVPMRDRGGPVGRTPEIEAELMAAAVELCRATRGDFLEVRTLDPLDAAAVADLPLVRQQHWITSRVDLSGGHEQTWKRLHQKVRQHVRKGEAQGVSVELDSSHDGLVRFFDAFVSARTAMGIPPFPFRFIEAVWKHLIVPGRANLLLAVHESTLINGMINLVSKDTVIAAYSAPQRQWAKLYPAEMVYWRTMEWGARSGFATFDFGADSPTQEGLIAFKAKFGAQTTLMSSYFYLHRTRTPQQADSSSESYALARRIWRMLPDSWSRVLGAQVTRRLS